MWPAFTIREAAARADDQPSTSSSSLAPAPAAAAASAAAAAHARRRRGGNGDGDRSHETSRKHRHHHRGRRDPASSSSSPSSPAAAAAAAAASAPDDDGRPTVETFSAKRDERIIVATPPDGLLFDLKLHARIPHPPERVFEVLADEEAHKIFRGIKETVRRDVLSDDGRGRRSLLVAHRAGLRFLGLTAAFETRLHIEEDRRAGTIRFKGADDGGGAEQSGGGGGGGGKAGGSSAGGGGGGGGDAFMRRFEGSWTVQPFTEAALARAYGGGGEPAAAADALGSLMARLGLGGSGSAGGGGGGGSKETLVTLEQALAPRLTPPRPVQPLVRALCGRTLQHMVDDLKEELGRRERERRRGGGGPAAA
jgi:hypothetical protein